MSILITALLFVLGDLPPDPPPEAPDPVAVIPGQAFEDLGCTCEATFRDGYRCDALPSFEDNRWTHDKAGAFAVQVGSFSAKLETALEGFESDYYLALQGWADRRTIGTPRLWGDVHYDCIKGHDPGDTVSNFDLAYLRACELRRLVEGNLGKQIELLEAVDFIDPANRVSTKETYSGGEYKAVVLFIVLPGSEACL